ncbi:MAG: hypothetical protein JW974_01435 [Alphaproteobacteria bacterium]|nr:hypothetical protein [Alphaproteobacteria bacterium]MBN2675445.1 hypothetical protein [Alphaproteobacteria bacterium]
MPRISESIRKEKIKKTGPKPDMRKKHTKSEKEANFSDELEKAILKLNKMKKEAETSAKRMEKQKEIVENLKQSYKRYKIKK